MGFVSIDHAVWCVWKMISFMSLLARWRTFLCLNLESRRIAEQDLFAGLWRYIYIETRPLYFDIGDEEFDEVCVVIDEVFCLLTECLILGHDIYENITKPMQLIVIFFHGSELAALILIMII